ncbi:hypothetical protein OESDEN_15363, partial [Oesophagostomum dentatum]
MHKIHAFLDIFYEWFFARVEYVSDVIVTRQDETPTELTPEPHAEDGVGDTANDAGASSAHAETNPAGLSRPETRTWMATRTPSDVDDDLDVLTPEAEESSS